MKPQVDIVLNGKGQGPLAKQLLTMGKVDVGWMRPWMDSKGNSWVTTFNGGDPNKRSNYKHIQVNASTLRRDEWKMLDTAVMDIARTRLNAIQDLIDRNLVYDLANGFGTTVLEWHDRSDSQEAVQTMDGITRGKNDRPEFQANYLPLPIVHVDYEINARELAASRNMGNGLDVIDAADAGRKVAEFLENSLVTNTTFTYGTADDRGRNKIYSYINHPDRNLVTLSDYGAWDDSSTSAINILRSVRAMKQAAIDAKRFGPYQLYVPTNFETRLDDDYDMTTPGTTIRERILKIDKIEGVKVIDALPSDNVLLVQMTPDVVRLVRGMPIRNVQWGEEGDMISKFKVMTIQVPQIRSDANGSCGVVHMS